MNLLDTIAPPSGSGRRRFGPMFLAKASFYVGVVAAGIFVFTSYVLFDNDRELEVIPATRVESEIFSPVQEFLMSSEVPSLNDRSVMVNCWSEFEDLEFNIEYLDRGSWRANAYYNFVRYHWRVDDLTLEVTRDPWVRSTNPSIGC